MQESTYLFARPVCQSKGSHHVQTHVYIYIYNLCIDPCTCYVSKYEHTLIEGTCLTKFGSFQRLHLIQEFFWRSSTRMRDRLRDADCRRGRSEEGFDLGSLF